MCRPIDVNSLDKVFHSKKFRKQIRFKGKCMSCGSDVSISITKTSGGYGFLRGFLYETKTGRFLVKCIDCYKTEKPVLKSATKYSKAI